MRKRILLSAVIALFGGLWLNNAEAQNVVEKGVGLVNVGLGIHENSLPLSASYDYALNGNLWDSKSALTLGVLGGTRISSDYTGFYIGPRLGLHYHFIPQLDTYMSLMLGYETGKNKKRDDALYTGNLRWGAHLGARYLFTPSVGMYAELGYGYSILNLGVTFRM